MAWIDNIKSSVINYFIIALNFETIRIIIKHYWAYWTENKLYNKYISMITQKCVINIYGNNCKSIHKKCAMIK